MGQPRPPVGPHDNEVGATLVGNVHNRLRRGAGSDIHIPGTLEGGRHEVAQLCQGCLVVVLEHHPSAGVAWRCLSASRGLAQNPAVHLAPL